MSKSRSRELLAILQQCFNPREEGWLWIAMYRDDLDSGVVKQIEGEYDDPGQTAATLAHVINESRTDHAFLALCRNEGRPREVDRELWRELRRAVAAESLIDMVVFSGDECWSMRAEDAASASVGGGRGGS